MVSKDQRKLQKRKKREKENRQQLLERRTVLRNKVKEEKEFIAREKRIDKLQKDLYDLGQYFDRNQLTVSPEQTLAQLEKNVEILKLLEDEHRRETDEKGKLNQDLEAKGYLTLEEKLSALHKATLEEQMGKEGLVLSDMDQCVSMRGSADCKMAVNDTADVSVISALKENS